MGLINLPHRPKIFKPIGLPQIDWDDPLARGLIGSWGMFPYEAGGNKVFDLSGNNNTGSLIADTHFVPGKFGSALDFDGFGDYVSIGDIPIFDGLDKITISYWAKHFDTNNRAQIAKETAYKIDINSNSYRFLSGDDWGGSILTASTSPVAGVWTHIVATYDGATKKMYFNGVQDATTVSTSGNLGVNTRILVFGGYYTTSFLGAYKGQFSDVMIYNRALSAGEVALLYREPQRFIIAPRERALFVLKPVGVTTTSTTTTSTTTTTTSTTTTTTSTTTTTTTTSTTTTTTTTSTTTTTTSTTTTTTTTSTTTTTTTTTTSTTTTTTTTSTTTTTTTTSTTTTTTSTTTTTTTTTSTTTTTTTTSTTSTTTTSTTTTGVSIIPVNLHIFSNNNDIEPNHLVGVGGDNRSSVLIKDSLEVQGSIYGGGATDYFKTETDGEVRLYGAARVIRHIRIGAGSWKPGSTAPTAGFSGVFPHLVFANGAHDEAHYEILVPHRRAAGTAMDIVVEWYYAVEDAQDNGTVFWKMEYLSCAPGENPKANGANVTGISLGTHERGKLVRTSFVVGAIGDGLINNEEPLGMRLWRDGDDATYDTLGKAAILIAVHLHFTMDKLGQAT